VGYKYGKIHRKAAKEVYSTNRSKNLSRPMGIGHKRHDTFLEVTMLVTLDSEEFKNISIFRNTVDR
jgi:hypothetical protein